MFLTNLAIHIIEDFSDCCTDSEIISGCRIEKSATGSAGWECLCGVGCEREFPFKTRTECETKLKGIKCIVQKRNSAEV